MKFLVNKTEKLGGVISISGNKSGTARALLLGALGDGVTTIKNPLHNIDSYSIIGMLEQLGAKFDLSDDMLWKVYGTGGKLTQPKNVLNAENSGTGFYSCTALASLLNGMSVMTGDYQICYRPAKPMIDALNNMGAKVVSTRDNGLAPLIIRGPLTGGSATMPGHNSQWFSPGILVCASLAENDSEITIEGEPLEKPYINMTIGMMKEAGLHVSHDDYKKYHITGRQKVKATDFVIPGDWGSSGYPTIATAITNSTAEFLNLDKNTYAGEKAYVDILNKAGCKVEYIDGGIRVTGSDRLVGQTIDCSGTPDAVPALAVLGCACKEGKTVLTNIKASRLKETDRTHIIKEELEKMGGIFEEDENSLTIYPSKLHGTFIDGHHDHRIVMATSVAALIAEGPTIIDNAEYVGVSYPEFYEHMKKLGAKIQRLDIV
ncbi:MAG TPA: 3-phosphoshikimate 1-carboxyvinyltransferase [Eubacteriales bacterium]|nr:3-phosphoshikimate 1-carboxyvinyltransferase [Eubacteriales bacterium]